MSRIILDRVLPTIGASYLLQWSFAAIFVPLQSEKFLDFCGLLGFIFATFFSLYSPYLKERFWLSNPDAYLPPLLAHAPRQLLLSGAVVMWASRLGTFLVRRVFRVGKDSRLDEIKVNPRRFFIFWTLQATWISLVGLPVWISNALPPSAHPSLHLRDYLGLSLFVVSFAIEVAADTQKSRWRHRKTTRWHDEKFISGGLWAISRHPNFVGEVGLWTGIWVLASNTMKSPLLPPGFLFGTLISPLGTYLLLTKLSGVPPLERAAEKRFGDDPKWKLYKRSVPIFFPWGPAGDFKI